MLGIRSTSCRYASHWNAFLFCKIVCCRKLHEIEEKLYRERQRASLAPPWIRQGLAPSTDFLEAWKRQEFYAFAERKSSKTTSLCLVWIGLQLSLWTYRRVTIILPPANEVRGKVIFSEPCVKNSACSGGAWSGGACSGGRGCGDPPAPPWRLLLRYASYWNAFLLPNLLRSPNANPGRTTSASAWSSLTLTLRSPTTWFFLEKIIWTENETYIPLVDPMGCQGCALSPPVQFLSFSCSFRQKLGQIIDFHSKIKGLEILNPPLIRTWPKQLIYDISVKMIQFIYLSSEPFSK